MDIVKQRRKRLMAWILAIVFCVSMWQGNVQATEGGDTLSGNDLESSIISENGTDTLAEGDEQGEAGNEEAGNEEVIVEYPLTIYFFRFLGQDSETQTFWVNASGLTKLGTWKSEFSGVSEMYQGVYSSDNSILSDMWFEGNENGDTEENLYMHKVIKWEFTPAKEGIVGVATNSLDLNDVAQKDSFELNAYLGKSVILSFYETMENEDGNISYQMIEDENIRSEMLTQEGEGGIANETLTIMLPRGGNDKGFISSWQRLEEQETGSYPEEGVEPTIPGEAYKGITSFENLEYETELKFVANYDKVVPSDGGTYYLVPSIAYNFESGYYTVTLAGDEQGDGFVYNGTGNDNELQEFYITGDSADYTFTPVTQ